MSDNKKKTSPKQYILYYLILGISTAILVFLDQFSKHWIVSNMQSDTNPLIAKPGTSFTVIPGIIDFDYIGNTGAAWSMFSGGRVFFIILTILFIIAALIAYGKISFTKKNVPLHVLTITMLSGAIGNLFDRVNNVIEIDGQTSSYVVDFIKTTFIKFPTFNVADIYVSVSVVVLIVLLLFFYKDEKTEKTKDSTKESNVIETYTIHKNSNNESEIIREDDSFNGED